jgi:hypothetical protein
MTPGAYPTTSSVPDQAKLKKRGDILFMGKKYKDALSVFTEAIALDKTSAVLFSNRAACHQALKE